jgi:hypothetical protein
MKCNHNNTWPCNLNTWPYLAPSQSTYAKLRNTAINVAYISYVPLHAAIFGDMLLCHPNLPTWQSTMPVIDQHGHRHRVYCQNLAGYTPL